jgi:Holliday junction resolvase RusA-like endonuclease
MTIHVTIPGEPVAQGRGRVGIVKLKTGGTRGTIHDPAKSKSWKAEVKFAMQRSVGGDKIAMPSGPIAVVLVLRFAGSTSDHRKTKPAEWRWRSKKPDASNVLKGIEDAGNGILWTDDSQIVDVRVLKTDAAQGDQPRCDLYVRPAGYRPQDVRLP